MQSESDEPSKSPAPKFHPQFCSEDGDIVLTSKDGTQFRLHSYVLKTTSSWFRAMLSLPQGQESRTDVLFVDEDEETLDPLLRMVSGLPMLPVSDFDTLERIEWAAEKYDMAGPMSLVRILTMTAPLQNQPFRLYAIACRRGWHEEAKIASSQTLTHNLYDPELRPVLQRLSADALLRLFELHHSRKEVLQQALNKPPFVASDNVSNCGNCNAVIDYHTWRELKYRMIQEIETRPLGDTILDKGLIDWPEAKACWLAKCPNRVCARFLYDQEPTMRIIRECIDELPRSI
ncbi:hypothetical protein FB45DRAFT_202919 [Roridomyces roridus]|uniref:BTB domain-containing protein n=1 Tax=Roridomyces roridus TaxID=1738132 RepID=A0AAD7CFU1_9AGAR|nr:hypothetical protein FB45DRAFT_202919 [Roridomyces roridus]